MELDVADTLAIHGLLARYGHKLDGQHFAELGELFTEDGVLDFTPIGGPYVCEGRQAILQWYSKAGHPLAHHVTNIDIESVGDDGDSAVVHSKWLTPQIDGVCGGGDYIDEVVRTPEGWRFARRTGVARPGASNPRPGGTGSGTALQLD